MSSEKVREILASQAGQSMLGSILNKQPLNNQAKQAMEQIKTLDQQTEGKQETKPKTSD